MASVNLTAPDSFGSFKGASLYGGVINGFNSGAVNGGVSAQTSWYAGLTVPTPLTGLKLGASYDYAGTSHDTATATPATYRDAFAVYASIQATEKLSFHTRGEYFWQGHALAGPGLPSKVLAITETLQYDLWKNVLSRLEVRWDHQAGTANAPAGTPDRAYGGELPGGAPSKRNAFLVAANIIYKF